MRNRRSRRNNNRLDRPQHHFGPVQSHLKPVEILSDDQVEAPAIEPAIREELDAYVAKRKEELA